MGCHSCSRPAAAEAGSVWVGSVGEEPVKCAVVGDGIVQDFLHLAVEMADAAFWQSVKSRSSELSRIMKGLTSKKGCRSYGFCRLGLQHLSKRQGHV